MHRTGFLTQTNHNHQTNKASPDVNGVNVSEKIPQVLRRILLDHPIRAYELSIILGITQQTIHQLLNHPEIYPKLDALLPIARFFKVTIGQLVRHEPLYSYKSTEPDEMSANMQSNANRK